MKKEDKYYCINNLSAMVIDRLKKEYPNEDIIDIFMDFYSSNTYKDLCDVDTRLWAEGPIYIMNMYLQEKHKK